ncbi:MAG: spore cortex biosynthesis protein YabQ [Lachnospiraceae bacterium]|nr:spore cortex biosynthesis protein YabQ [Lachnospiraceae bacterium]
MSGMIYQEADFLLVSLLWGMGLTAVYDILRIARAAIRHASFVVAVEDFLYWIFAAFALFFLLFSMNDGNLRWYALAGAAAGMWLYHITLSRLLVKWLGTALGFVVKGLAFPLKILGRLLKKQRRWLTIKCKKILLQKKKHRKRPQIAEENRKSKKKSEKTEKTEGSRGGRQRKERIQKTE